jgi:hypothetical protein
LYVGLAMYCFEKRVWTHDAHMPRHWIDIIPIVDDYIILAPALEFYLITSLKPALNTVYQNYTCPEGGTTL